MHAKSFADTYLYNKYPNYEKQMVQFIMTAERLDLDDPAFENILIDFRRRQTSSALLSVLKSKNVILCIAGKALSQQFKVLTCKDIKYEKNPNAIPKTFIDVTDIFSKGESGNYECSQTDVLIARVIAAMTNTIYYRDPKRIIYSGSAESVGATAYAKLFCHVLEYIHKISTIPGLKERATYMCAMFYLVNMISLDESRASIFARKISGISEREEEIINMLAGKDCYENIKFFVEALETTLKVGNLTVDMVVEKWMYLYGITTVFALELYPSFAQMLTDAYVGAYINNQKTIEKVCGREMVDFTKIILNVGGSAV